MKLTDEQYLAIFRDRKPLREVLSGTVCMGGDCPPGWGAAPTPPTTYKLVSGGKEVGTFAKDDAVKILTDFVRLFVAHLGDGLRRDEPEPGPSVAADIPRSGPPVTGSWHAMFNKRPTGPTNGYRIS